MQSENGSSENSSQITRQIEDLVDVLLGAYPDGANSPDDQECYLFTSVVANSSQPNERILDHYSWRTLLAWMLKINTGATPIAQWKVKAVLIDMQCWEAMSRAKLTTERVVEAIREETLLLLLP
jgi:hypothetical protein